MSKTIEIMWDDLTEAKKQEILEVFGDNNNWDICPITIIEVEDEDGDEEPHDCLCPLGGDEHDDCADCAYAGDYHFVDGECVIREDDDTEADEWNERLFDHFANLRS